MKDLFVTALDIPPEQHVRIQAAFQKYTDNAVSKTVNLPNRASVGDVLDVYNLAYDLGCKGIIIFMYGSRSQCFTWAMMRSCRDVSIVANVRYVVNGHHIMPLGNQPDN